MKKTSVDIRILLVPNNRNQLSLFKLPGAEFISKIPLGSVGPLSWPALPGSQEGLKL